METRTVDVAITEPDGTVVFERPGVVVPAFWSDRAATIVASKYFSYNENSVIDLVKRIVEQITRWGIEQKYFKTLKKSHEFANALADILLYQRAAFNSPVWFNIGVPENSNQVAACQPYWSLVNTSKGLLPIGRIVEENMIGLHVAGGGKIVAVKHNGRKKVLRITTNSGHYIEVTPDHLVYSNNSYNSKWEPSDQDRCFKRADELKPGDRLLLHRCDEAFIKDWEYEDLKTQAEAYLAGWLQGDGFVGQYDHGTNGSLIIEGLTINKDEQDVFVRVFENVFPNKHYKIRNCRTEYGFGYERIRSYGEELRWFVDKYHLLDRGVEMTVPNLLYTAPLGVVRQYLRAWFQSDGYVTTNSSGSTKVGIGVISPMIIEGLQLLLQRFGIYSRTHKKTNKRVDRHDVFELLINVHSEALKFRDLIGFVSQEKREKLDRSLDISAKNGQHTHPNKNLEIKSISTGFTTDVYDIQTEKGIYHTNGVRVHNCFIYDVKDDMVDILAHAQREGMTFKSGSGAGVNVSKLRAKGELLSNRGKASGPLSFMRIWDQTAGSIKSGGKTRRSAKMVVMDVNHPDIEEFIECKRQEEQKALALIKAGFSREEAYSTISFQNANHSIMVTDEFMEAVDDDKPWNLINRGDRKIAKTIRARELFRKITEVAWATGDPGIQFYDTINNFNPVPSLGKINCSNPCAEHVAINNSACNLASLNLVAYLQDGKFNDDKFIEDIYVIITAQDIMIDMADYPTPETKEVAHKTRPLGLGFCNLGAYLMLQGMPYDSPDARDEAARITRLMTEAAYNISIRLAEIVGPYEAFIDNQEKNIEIVAELTENEELAEKARELGIRNSQLTLLAPTGTISFLMDCDSTGIEPLFALEFEKKLAGGGTLKMVPACVEKALSRGGVTIGVETISSLVDEQRAVFKTANDISPHDHLLMMAACQPHLNGAISKTVNLPAEATVDDVEDIYMTAWRQGLKSVAIYRYGCKQDQPLSVHKEPEQEQEAVVLEPEKWAAIRRKLPDTRQSITHKFDVNGFEGYLTVGFYESGEIGEIFIRPQKQGTTVQGLLDGFATAISLGLQYGVPPETFVEKFMNSKFEPAGFTRNEEIRMASSILDYMFKWIKIQLLDDDEDDPIVSVDIETTLPNQKKPSIRMSFDGPPCPNCQTITGRSGSCYVCSQCGSTTGCS